MFFLSTVCINVCVLLCLYLCLCLFTCLCPSSSWPSWWGTRGSRSCRCRRRQPGWQQLKKVFRYSTCDHVDGDGGDVVIVDLDHVHLVDHVLQLGLCGVLAQGPHHLQHQPQHGLYGLSLKKYNMEKSSRNRTLWNIYAFPDRNWNEYFMARWFESFNSSRVRL